MVDEVWLHIGTPKSGTSSLQKHLNAHRNSLSDQGLAYLSPEGKSAYNDLAIAIKRARPELPDLVRDLNHQIATRPEKRALISSEMLYGVAPETITGLLPAIAERPLNVLVYVRRQDKYIEAMFLQKAKNGRFHGSIADYIEKFSGSGSDFHEMLTPWQEDLGATLVPRVLERDKLVGGDVVTDAFAQMGLAAPDAQASDDVNVSPGLARVQLLQAAAAADLANPRRLQRQLAARFPQDASARAPIMSLEERRAFLARYDAGNEALRARYFPDNASLFDMDDLQIAQNPVGVEPFSDAQLQEITQLLKVAKSLHSS